MTLTQISQLYRDSQDKIESYEIIRVTVKAYLTIVDLDKYNGTAA